MATLLHLLKGREGWLKGSGDSVQAARGKVWRVVHRELPS